MFSWCLQDFPGCCQDAPMGLVGLVEFADHYKWKYGLWWSQLFDDPSYSMIPAIRWSPAIWWSQAIRWSPAIRWSQAIRLSIRGMDFDNRKVYVDTSITNGLVMNIRNNNNNNLKAKPWNMKAHPFLDLTDSNSSFYRTLPWAIVFNISLHH